jgi:hypothetical protein
MPARLPAADLVIRSAREVIGAPRHLLSLTMRIRSHFTRPKHKNECKRRHVYGYRNPDAEERDLLEQMIASEPYITHLVVAAVRKYLWRPENISGGKLTRHLRIEYTYKVRRIAPPSHTRPSATLAELQNFPKSYIPFILNITPTEPTEGSGEPGGTLLCPPLILVVFRNRDTGHFFQYLPMVGSAAAADDRVRSQPQQQLALTTQISKLLGAGSVCRRQRDR